MQSPRSLSILIFIICFLLSLGGCWIARSMEREGLRAKSETVVLHYRDLITNVLSERAKSLERMANRWDVQEDGTPEKLWRVDALNYAHHLTGLTGVGYATADTIIRWIEPVEENKAAVGFEMQSESRRSAAIRSARRTLLPTLTQAIELRQKGLGFLLLVPLRSDNGLIFAAVRFREFIKELVREKAYAIALTENGRLLYESGVDEPLASAFWKSSVTLPLEGTEWTLSATPTLATLSKEEGILPTLILLVGIVFSFLMAWLAFLYRVARLAKSTAESLTIWNHAIVHGSQLTIVSTDANGLVKTFNPAAERLLGYSADEVINKVSFALWHDPIQLMNRANQLSLELKARIQPDFEVIAAKAKRGLAYQETWDILCKTGERKIAMLAVHALADGNGQINGYVGFVEDITEKVSKDRTLKEALEKAESATRSKSLFLANMSHEIRTPINGVLGMANLLNESNLSKEQREFVKAIKISGENLRIIINDILDLSKIEAGKLELELTGFQLDDLASGIGLTVAQIANEKGIDLAFSLPPNLPARLLGDPTRLRQILLNLVSNAIKFTKEGSVSVRILVQSFDKAEAHLRFEVTDTGIGIAKETQQKLFQSFAQADSSTTRKFGGTGLGLSICRELVELMHGHIGIISELGQGSTFWFEVRFPVAEQKVQAVEARAVDVQKDLRILLADDNKINQTIARKILEKFGYVIKVAGNGKEVLVHLEKQGFDLILMDCEMPEMDGFETTHAIRHHATEAFRQIPIIAMTANAMLGDKERCLAAGMTDYVAKPIRTDELMQAISRVVQSKQAAA